MIILVLYFASHHLWNWKYFQSKHISAWKILSFNHCVYCQMFVVLSWTHYSEGPALVLCCFVFSDLSWIEMGHKLYLKHQTWAWTWPPESSGNPDVSLAPAIIMHKWVSALINIFSRLPSIKRAELWENTESFSRTRDKPHLQSDATQPVSAYLLTSLLDCLIIIIM